MVRARLEERVRRALEALEGRAAAEVAAPEGVRVVSVRQHVVRLQRPVRWPLVVDRVRVAVGRRVERVHAAPVRLLHEYEYCTEAVIRIIINTY